MRASRCDELYITTDDGSTVFSGFASDVLKGLLNERTINREV